MKPVSPSSAGVQFLRDLNTQIVGSPVLIEKREADWVIEFADGFAIGVGTLWRLIGAAYVCITSEDDGHQFGLPAPVDSAAQANRLLSGKNVKEVEFDSRTGDLRLHFEGPLVLEILTTSVGYETWQMWHRGEYFAVGASGGLR